MIILRFQLDNEENSVLRKMFVGGLNAATTTESMKEYFEKFSEVSHCTVMKDSETQRIVTHCTMVNDSEVSSVLYGDEGLRDSLYRDEGLVRLEG